MIKDSLIKLRSLVDNLEDRDKALKNDHGLFEKFFENFPIPVSMWSVNAEGKVLSCKGNGFLNDIAKTEDDLFVCNDVAEKIENAKSEQKDIKELFLETDDATYFAKILTRREGNTVIGTMGMAWDVSSNITMLGTLTKIMEIESQKDEANPEVMKLLTNAIGCSRLRVLVERIYNQ